MTRLHCLLPALAALGAGLIHIAVGAGAPIVLAVVFVLIGVSELFWAVWTLVADRLIAPRIFLCVFLIPLLVWGGIAFFLPDFSVSLPFLSLLIASFFSVFVAATIAIFMRSAENGPEKRGLVMMGLLVGAGVVSGLTTPALAASNAGQHAQPHGEHRPEGDPQHSPHNH